MFFVTLCLTHVFAYSFSLLVCQLLWDLLPFSAVSFFQISLSLSLLSCLASSNSSHSMLFCHASQIDLEVGQRWHVLFATIAVFLEESCHFSVHLTCKTNIYVGLASLCCCSETTSFLIIIICSSSSTNSNSCSSNIISSIVHYCPMAQENSITYYYLHYFRSIQIPSIGSNPFLSYFASKFLILSV